MPTPSLFIPPLTRLYWLANYQNALSSLSSVFLILALSSASSDCWVDVGGPAECQSDATTSHELACNTGEATFYPTVPSLATDGHSDDPKPWVSTVDSVRKRLLQLLRKCLLQTLTENARFRHLSAFERMHRQNAMRDLRLKRVARFLRKAMATLFWCSESCFILHHWCLTQLSEDMLQLYCDGFYELWQQGRITSLLSKLNKLVSERDSSLSATQSPALRVLQLTQIETNSTEASRLPSLAMRTLPGAQTGFPYRRPGVYSTISSEQPILACMTFPINPKSNRLNNLLRDLGVVGKVSVETSEEQASDRMRIRLWFYVRRILRLSEEAKNQPVYLVGFGVSSLLVLRAWMHLSTMERRSEHLNIAGIICIAMPLIGLKGVRGIPSDPLLTIPNLPTLIIIGSRSRLGNYQHAVNFRRRLITARRSESLKGDEPADESQSKIHICVVNGADHLLRLRPTMRSQWTMVQSEVDKRVVSTVDRFVRQNERASNADPNSETEQFNPIQRSSHITSIHSRLPHTRKLQTQARRIQSAVSRESDFSPKS